MPQIKRSLFAFLFFVSAAILVGISEPHTAHAQTCAYADIINQSDLDLDTAAVCAAAQPWAQDGYKLLIFLTDTPVRNETVWFDLIDGVEASVGLRDLSQTDAFDTNGLAFEAATLADWATSITFGDSLFQHIIGQRYGHQRSQTHRYAAASTQAIRPSALSMRSITATSSQSAGPRRQATRSPRRL